MSTEIHCCLSNKCTGEIYAGLFLDCKFCGNPIFIQCMRARDTEVKAILLAFGLAKFNSNGHFVVISGDSDRETTFMNCFKPESAFSVSCEVCTDRFRKSSDDRNVEPSLIQRKVNLQAIKNNKQLKHADKITVALDSSNITQQTLIPVNVNDVGESSNESLEIYITNFPPKTDCDAISTLITNKTTLHADSFVVTKMVNPKKGLKYMKFMSFRIKASNKQTYNSILNDDIWMPFTKAVPFNANAKVQSKERKQQKRKLKKDNQKQPAPQKSQKPPQSAVKPVIAQKKQQNVNHPHDNHRSRTHQHKSSQSHSGKGQKSARQSNGPSNGSNNRSRIAGKYNSVHCGCHNDCHKSNVSDRQARVSNFHVEKWNNHRPLNDDLKSVLSLLRRVLDQY